VCGVIGQYGQYDQAGERAAVAVGEQAFGEPGIVLSLEFDM